MSDHRATRYLHTRKQLETAFGDYLADKRRGLEPLLRMVEQFAKSKVIGAIFDNAEGAETHDDYAQEVVITVWQKIHTCKKDPKSFYAWLNRICYTRGVDAHTTMKEEIEGRVPLLLESEDDPGVMEDNPALSAALIKSKAIVMPDCIQGSDLRICDYIREGLSYKDIGQIMGLTTNAVTLRVRKMRKQLENRNV